MAVQISYPAQAIGHRHGLFNPAWQGYGFSQQEPIPFNSAAFPHEQSSTSSNVVYYPVGNVDNDPMTRELLSYQSAGCGRNSSTLGTSSFSGHTRKLEHRRKTSPGFLTPTNSESSRQDYIGRPRAAWESQGDFPQQDQSNGTAVEAGLSPNYQPLRGLAISPRADGNSPLIPKDVLEPPLGGPPGQLQPSRKRHAPWSPLSIQFEDPGGIRASAYGCSSTGSGSPKYVEESRKHGVRIRALSPEKRVKANDVRALGACLRCWFYRESCSVGTPCDRCKSTPRTWQHGCIRIKFKEMWRHLQPDELAQHLQSANVEAFLKNNHYHFDYSRQPSFMLPLGWILGRPILINVKEIKPFGDKLLQHDAFLVRWWTKDHPEVKPFALNSPPLMPDFSSGRQNWTEIQDQVKAWLNEMLHEPDGHIIWHCFWDDEEQWQREIFLTIWKYHKLNIKDHEMLSDALRLLILVHGMTTSLTVPEEAVQDLRRNLKNSEQYTKHQDAPISPKSVNTAIKMCAYPLVQHLAQATMKNLQAKVQSKSESRMETDLTLCLALVSLAVLGKNQGAVLDLARVQRDREDVTLTMERAEELIRDMESNFTQNVVRLCQCKFKKSQKCPKTEYQCASEGEAHARSFGLFDRVQRITFDELEDLPERKELDEDLDETSFSATNTKRVLAKFIDRVFPDWVRGS